MQAISDDLWLEANLNPEPYRTQLGLRIPGLPADEVQTCFTGRTGRPSLQQAFDFYKFVLNHLPTSRKGRYHLLDFGGGWGRILRFFLREFEPDRVVLVDCWTEAVREARALNPPFEVIHSPTEPPLPFERASIDACYAFSVFSHLSELACHAWIRHLADLLVPGGRLIFTTRGSVQIKYLQSLKPRRTLASRARKFLSGIRLDEAHPLLEALPPPHWVQRLYDDGVFQFYPKGGGELSSDFYGETWIPERWMRERHRSLGFSSWEYFREFGAVDQCVFVLTK